MTAGRPVKKITIEKRRLSELYKEYKKAARKHTKFLHENGARGNTRGVVYHLERAEYFKGGANAIRNLLVENK